MPNHSAMCAKIKSCPNKVMAGEELKRLRVEAGLTQLDLAEKMKGWGWYRDKVVRLEGFTTFELHPDEMQALLSELGAVSICLHG